MYRTCLLKAKDRMQCLALLPSNGPPSMNSEEPVAPTAPSGECKYDFDQGRVVCGKPGSRLYSGGENAGLNARVAHLEEQVKKLMFGLANGYQPPALTSDSGDNPDLKRQLDLLSDLVDRHLSPVIHNCPNSNDCSGIKRGR
jgi:hypothetical protein